MLSLLLDVQYLQHNAAENAPFLACALGVLAHQVLFIRGEWHLWAPTVAVLHVMAFLVFAFGSTLWPRTSLLWTSGSYVASLFTSIAIYRIYFHRLSGFPGPKLAALSKLWHVWQCRDSRNHVVLEELHQQYGTIVRTGETTGSETVSPSSALLQHHEISRYYFVLGS